MPFAIFPLQSWLEWIEPTDREIEIHNLQSLTSGVSFSFVHSWVDKENQNRYRLAKTTKSTYVLLLINLWLSFCNSYTLSPHIRLSHLSVEQVQKYRVDAYGPNTQQVHSNCRPGKHLAGAQ